MPELSDALHQLYDDEARVYSTPSRGLSSLSSAARAARRRTMVRSGALGCVGVVAVTGLVLGTFQFLRPDAVEPLAPPSPSPTVPEAPGVVWDPEAAAAVATAGFDVPECGEEFAPASVEVGSVRPVVEARLNEPAEPHGATLAISTTFDSTGGSDAHFLGNTWSYVVTRDGIVVAVDVTFDQLELETTGVNRRGANPATMFGQWMCDTQSALQQLYDERDYDPEDHTDAEWAAIQEDVDAIVAAHQQIPPGTYRVYAVSPVVFGEQAEVAVKLIGTGLSSVGSLRSDLGSTHFADDPRLAPYCVGSDDSGVYCNPPREIVDEVLTVEVDPTLVVDRPSGVAISAPVTVEVPEQD